MGRNLAAPLKASLGDCEEHTTVRIQLATGQVLRYATATVSVKENGVPFSYKGLLEVVDPLRMSLTETTDRINFKIDNTTLNLGRVLIGMKSAFNKSRVMIGSYFKNSAGTEWHVKKIPGTITTAEISGDVITAYFLSRVDAANYKGRKIIDVFPDAVMPAPEPPPGPIYNDVTNYYEAPDRTDFYRQFNPILNDPRIGRYQEIELFSL